MNKTKMLEWIGTRHVGVSSRTMWVALMGVARGVNDEVMRLKGYVNMGGGCYCKL